MDVAGLRNELEQHLGKNPHEDAPDGFRDRFEAIVEELESGNDHVAREVREAQLRRICDEAEAAGAAGSADGDAPPASEPRPERGDTPVTPRPDRPAKPAGPAEADQGAPARRLVPLALLVVILVAAYFILR